MCVFCCGVLQIAMHKGGASPGVEALPKFWRHGHTTQNLQVTASVHDLFKGEEGPGIIQIRRLSQGGIWSADTSDHNSGQSIQQNVFCFVLGRWAFVLGRVFIAAAKAGKLVCVSCWIFRGRRKKSFCSREGWFRQMCAFLPGRCRMWMLFPALGRKKDSRFVLKWKRRSKKHKLCGTALWLWCLAFCCLMNCGQNYQSACVCCLPCAAGGHHGHHDTLVTGDLCHFLFEFFTFQKLLSRWHEKNEIKPHKQEKQIRNSWRSLSEQCLHDLDNRYFVQRPDQIDKLPTGGKWNGFFHQLLTPSPPKGWRTSVNAMARSECLWRRTPVMTTQHHPQQKRNLVLFSCLVRPPISFLVHRSRCLPRLSSEWIELQAVCTRRAEPTDQNAKFDYSTQINHK